MDKSILDVCYTNGNSIVMLSNLLLLGLSVVGLSLFENVVIRTMMIIIYFIIIGQYSIPVLLNEELDLETKKTARNSLIVTGFGSFFINVSLLSLTTSYKPLIMNSLIYSVPTILGFIITPPEINVKVNIKANN